MAANTEQQKKEQKTSNAASVAGEVLETASDIIIIDSLVDLAGDIISGILD